MAWPYGREALAVATPGLSFGAAPACGRVPTATLPSPEVAALATLGSAAALRAVLRAELERDPQVQEIIFRCACVCVCVCV